MKPNLIDAIYKLYPQVTTTLNDTAYDKNGNEVSYDAKAVQQYVDDHAYIQKREKEYPPMVNYLDGIVKGNTAQVQAYIDACLAVKEKYPKP